MFKDASNNINGTFVGNVTGNVSGTAATVTGAAQTNITSVGTLSSLTTSGDITVGDDLTINGGVIDFKSNSGSPASLKMYCEVSNQHFQTLQPQPHSASAENTLRLPDSGDDGTQDLVAVDITQTLTNKTLTSPKINEDVALTATATELNLLDGVSGLVQADFTKLAAIDSTATELNILDGVTATTAELNILDGVTSTTAELNILDGVTATASELNILDGKSFVDEDDMASDSATAIASQQSIKAYVDAQKADMQFVLEDGDGTEVQITKDKEVKFVEGGGLDINWTDTSTGSDGDPYDLTFTVNASQTGITSLTNASLVIGRDADNDIDFSTDNQITFRANGADQIKLSDGALAPVTDNDIDLGTSSLEFKNAFFDGTVTADAFSGPLTGNVTGNVSGTAATVTGAAQSNITSLGTLTTLTVDNVIVNGTTIGHTDDTDLMTVADGVLTVAGEVSMTTLDIGGTNVTATATELNIMDGVTATTSELNIMDGVTSTTAELNILDGVTATASELNIMDGVTSTTAELNILDGVTATASELNLLDGNTSVGSSITVSDSDGIVVNDGGTMKTIPASDIKTYAGGTSATKGFATAMAIAL